MGAKIYMAPGPGKSKSGPDRQREAEVTMCFKNIIPAYTLVQEAMCIDILINCSSTQDQIKIILILIVTISQRNIRLHYMYKCLLLH